MDQKEELLDFLEYTKSLKGDEKGEAQLFCDRLFRAFGHGGIIEANGSLEARIKFSSGRTKFADCLWSPKGRSGVLIEMKKKSYKALEGAFPQARDYWIEMNPEKVIGEGAQKPEYIILCNFDKFLIYRQLTLVDEININELSDRSGSFNFLLKQEKEPIFNHNVKEISEDAARTVGELFKYLIFNLNEPRDQAQSFLLQCVLALFSEDFGLLPDYFFAELVKRCLDGESSYDLLGGLFKQMANPKPAKGGQFKDIKYFNGGLFDEIESIELDKHALDLLFRASKFNWKHVNPAIFGSLFEGTMNAKERHAFGAHFTAEEDVQKIINPTIIKPWKDKIEKANTLSALKELHTQLGEFRVLDPSCGCGNFLFVSFMALKELEMTIIEKMAESFSRSSLKSLDLGVSRVSSKQFYGIDILPIAVEVAKMTMMIAKELAADNWNARIGSLMGTLGLSFDEGLPLDNLDECIYQSDAVLDPWPDFDALVGNPPYQSKNKMQKEMDPAYIDAIREAYPDIPGNADFCVYWIRKAHENMKTGQRAGIVATNTVRQNYSREGGLDYVTSNNGIITNAVSTQVWSGDATVYVSIINWIKGDAGKDKKLLSIQIGDSIDSPFEYHEMESINSALSLGYDVSSANVLAANKASKSCYQGQTHGNKAFLIDNATAEQWIASDQNYKDILFPFLIADELIGAKDSLPKRHVIDFRKHDAFSIKKYPLAYELIKETVHANRKKKAEEEDNKNTALLKKRPNAKTNKHHANFYKEWWKLSYPRNDLMEVLAKTKRYITCGRVTKRPIFETISSNISPNDALVVFPFEDDYSFGVLQSSPHCLWFQARCSTLKGDWRYTSNTVFDSFPWPQAPSKNDVIRISKLGRELRLLRRKVMTENDFSLRDLYRIIEESPSNQISEAQKSLDEAVLSAYRFKKTSNIIFELLLLNQRLFDLEESGKKVMGPGLPQEHMELGEVYSEDCISVK